MILFSILFVRKDKINTYEFIFPELLTTETPQSAIDFKRGISVFPNLVSEYSTFKGGFEV